ncbi:MAG: tetratricopeptide repeat protein [Nitrospirota bacterium]
MASRDDTRSPDLQKLEEKLRRDPGSKLFFPLAEEYTKAGRLNEAISLLRSGIKAHPDFLGARVALGKALLTKGQVSEAKREFEQVVAANPDNLMAHKKLAAIYAKEGDKRKALASCELILAVNPTDAEAVRLRTSIGALPDVSPEDEATVKSQVSSVPSPETEATVVDRLPAVDESVEPTVVEPTLVARAAADPEIAEATEVMQLPPQMPAAAAAPAPEGTDAPKGEGAAADEELATVSLADLYVAQGHYQRAIAVYRRILERTPNDAEVAAKLENAVTLERLLAPQAVDAEVMKADLVHQVLARDEATGAEPDSADLQPSLAGAPTGASRHQAAIQRLEVWLTRIAERRRR